MFGLTQLFAALRRLSDSVNRTADLVDGANFALEQRLMIHDQDTPVVEVIANAPIDDSPAESSEEKGRGRRNGKVKA